jgi:hypothetical protein
MPLKVNFNNSSGCFASALVGVWLLTRRKIEQSRTRRIEKNRKKGKTRERREDSGQQHSENLEAASPGHFYFSAVFFLSLFFIF